IHRPKRPEWHMLRCGKHQSDQDANTPAGVLRVRGERLTLLAMTAGELRIGGRIDSVEWVGPC
ncbi:MAG: hypothetical protein HFF94_04385, partial [Oscillibacter sp.]|nr:hypothetical protein [Oscillibacter sp.]